MPISVFRSPLPKKIGGMTWITSAQKWRPPKIKEKESFPEDKSFAPASTVRVQKPLGKFRRVLCHHFQVSRLQRSLPSAHHATKVAATTSGCAIQFQAPDDTTSKGQTHHNALPLPWPPPKTVRSPCFQPVATLQGRELHRCPCVEQVTPSSYGSQSYPHCAPRAVACLRYFRTWLANHSLTSWDPLCFWGLHACLHWHLTSRAGRSPTSKFISYVCTTVCQEP